MNDTILPIAKPPVEEPTGSAWPTTSWWLWASAAGDGAGQPWATDFPHDGRR